VSYDDLKKRIMQYAHFTPAIEICPSCKGKGYERWATHKEPTLCRKCDGEGRLIKFTISGSFSITLHDEDADHVDHYLLSNDEPFYRRDLKEEAVVNSAKEELLNNEEQ
jgi:hypothetical protein